MNLGPKTVWVNGGYAVGYNLKLLAPQKRRQYVSEVLQKHNEEPEKVMNVYTKVFKKKPNEGDRTFVRRCAGLDYSAHQKSRLFLLKGI